MAYTPINWQTGDTITAEKLNKMDNGWGYEGTELFSETVTTELYEGDDYPSYAFSYFNPIVEPTITVTFDGTDYQCERIEEDGTVYYGGWGDGMPDLSVIPFFIITEEGENIIYTEDEGTYAVTVASSSLEVSDAFADAVSLASDAATAFRCVDGETTCSDMLAAISAGQMLYTVYRQGIFYITGISAIASSTAVSFLPELSQNTMTMGFDSEMVFAIYQY